MVEQLTISSNVTQYQPYRTVAMPGFAVIIAGWYCLAPVFPSVLSLVSPAPVTSWPSCCSGEESRLHVLADVA